MAIKLATDSSVDTRSSVKCVRQIAGIVLCGGASTRMGSPKEWLEVDGETLLQRTGRVMLTVVSPVVVVSRSGQVLPTLPGDVRHAFDEVDGEGPLRGLHSGLTTLANDFDAALVVACDHPALDAGFVGRMVARSNDDYDATIVHWPDGRICPLPGVYRTTLVGRVARLLSERRRSLKDLLQECTVLSLTPADFADVDPAMQSMLNVNRPEEWKQWRGDDGDRSA